MNSRNSTLDLMKAIAAIGVVLVHFQFPGVIGKILCATGVVGVIVFFFISGYSSYCNDKDQSGVILVRFKRNLKLLLVAVVIYFVFTVIEQLCLGTFNTFVEKLADPLTYVQLFILGNFEFIHGDLLWYMVALLYGYLIIWIMERYRLHKIFYILMPLLIILRICMETHTNSFQNPSWLTWHFSGNFLAGALPIMLLGNFIASHKDKYENADSKLKFLLIGTVSLILTFVFVNIKVGEIDISQPFKILAAYGFFAYALQNPGIERPAVLVKLGKEYSLYLYLYHMVIGTIIKDIIVVNNGPQWVISYGLPIVVIVVSIIVSYEIVKIKKQ